MGYFLHLTCCNRSDKIRPYIVAINALQRESMMNIVYLITALGVGGAENLLADVCGGLKNKHNITILYLNPLNHYQNAFAEMNIATECLELKKNGIIKTINRIRAIIKEKRADVLHTHLPSADTIGRLAGLMCRNVKVISTIHNCDEWKQSKSVLYLLLKLFNRLTVNFSRRVRLIAVSDAVREYCIKHEKIKSDKIRTIHNFVDFNNPRKKQKDFVLPYDKEKFIIVTVSRLDKQKGHILLLEAIRSLVNTKKRENILVLILGDGDLKNTLADYVEQNNLSQYVKLVGSQDNVYDYLENADLFVSPSYYEGFGISTLEAFYNKTPALLSDIAVHLEISQNASCAVIFETGNSKSLEEKIIAIMDGEIPMQSMTGRAYDFCISLSIDKHLDELLSIYSKN